MAEAQHESHHDPGAAYSEVFEEGNDVGKKQNIHRIRANSSIMKLKKILGKFSLPSTSWSSQCGKLHT